MGRRPSRVRGRARQDSTRSCAPWGVRATRGQHHPAHRHGPRQRTQPAPLCAKDRGRVREAALAPPGAGRPTRSTSAFPALICGRPSLYGSTGGVIALVLGAPIARDARHDVDILEHLHRVTHPNASHGGIVIQVLRTKQGSMVAVSARSFAVAPVEFEERELTARRIRSRTRRRRRAPATPADFATGSHNPPTDRRTRYRSASINSTANCRLKITYRAS